MQLSDLIFATVSRIFRPPAPQAAERKLLQIPVHDEVDKPSIKKVLAAAAEQLATSGKLYKWLSPNGIERLTCWDPVQKVFTLRNTEDWMIYFGRNWIIKDSNGREYAGPSLVVTDRLIQAVLKHPALGTASWALQLQRKREAIK
jgi:hypothetical protein